ncbi:uncharacterized protein LOC126378736 [Pectinophora gossypiella]|uniref:uncharacterized protein LOC126378736 n=1 Tax=Pectinophora gossypiella TaxID=13191 RepID=UPI00214F41E8|nr:uncharacterized protein LOC126378736 [Pectinophora gossypiella]
MRPSLPFIRGSATFSLNYESDADRRRAVSAKRSRSVDSLLRHQKGIQLKEKKSSIDHTSRGSVKEGTDNDNEHESTSTENESTTAVSESEITSKLDLSQKETVVSLCPVVRIQRYRQALARKWTTEDPSQSSTDTDENLKTEELNKKTISYDPCSNVFRVRSKSWAGECQSEGHPLRSGRSENQGVLLFYMGKTQDQPAAGDYGKSELHSCICTPSQPPSPMCSTLNEEEDDENRMIYLKRFMVWLTFVIKLILFTSLWVLLLYWFLMSAGFVNVNEVDPRSDQIEWNTYIEKYQDFKFLPINNTYDTVELEVRMQGPFGDSNVFFNCQFERLYYHKDNFNRTDVKRDDADDVEVDHRIYEDSYSAVTSTTTRRTMSYTHTTTYWGTKYYTYSFKFFLVFPRFLIVLCYISGDCPYIPIVVTRTMWTKSTRTRTSSMTWWTFTTITARLTRYNLSRHPMTSFTVQEPYNFVPWGNVRMYGYTFSSFRAVDGRYHGHRHYANTTADSNVTVTYGMLYALNMTTVKDFINNTALDAVAFAIEITKGRGRTSTSTTPEPPNVISPADGVKYSLIVIGLILALLFLQTSRVLALFIMAVACMSIMAYLKIKPGADTIATWLNLDYILELLYVMTLVAATTETGLYDFLAVIIYNICARSIFGITFVMCALSFVLAAFMDCVAAILFLTPLAISVMTGALANKVAISPNNSAERSAVHSS